MAALDIPNVAREAARRWPEREAIVDGDVRITFAQLEERMIEAAAAFVAAGLQPGEKVALMAPNGWRWVVACLGLQAAGGVLVPLNTRFKASEADYILRKSGAAFAVAFDHFVGTSAYAMLAGLELPNLRRLVKIDGDGPDGWDRFLGAAQEADRAEALRRVDAIDPDAICDIIFTSGTTGDPKGVLTTYRQSVATSRAWAQAVSLSEADSYAILWPYFHTSGYKAGWVACLVAGAVNVPVPVLDAAELVELVEREKITFLPGPPTLFQTLLAIPEVPRRQLASVRLSITGASSVAPSLIEAMRGDLGIPHVITGYGMTETCGTITMADPTDSAEVLTTTSGKPIPGLDVRIVDEAGAELPQGESGEIVVRGFNVMQGYLDDAEATAKAFLPGGWLQTGDIGRFDAAGNLQITDRKKEVFIVGGFNCYPAEIEKALMAHPDIENVAVTGMPDARMGEVGLAYVVLKQGRALTEGELIAWARDRISNYKVPRRVVFLDALPLTATGKVQKFKLPRVSP